ncbi:MAG: holo-ACP synthase [Gemmatimonadetes bacterium]|nr:holo-ACP synthase [Gemmatimonadota bacterium]
MIVGVGLDLVDIARVERLLADKGDRATAKLFTESEARYATSRAHPARHFAARFAAKEAAYKALAGNELARGIGWRDLEVLRDDVTGQPRLVLHGRAAERAAELGVTRLHLTLTHSHETAAAVVVLERD